MDIFDNISKIVGDDIAKTTKQGSCIKVAAACFSIYAYSALKEQLENVSEFQFIFTKSTFVKERENKKKREFYIPRLERERSLYGTDFEIRLRNEISQKAIAKECADWIYKRAHFKSNVSGQQIQGFMVVKQPSETCAYMPLNDFTTAGIGLERGNNLVNPVIKLDAPQALQFLQQFDSLWNDPEKMQDVTATIIENIAAAYNENSPQFIYFVTLYNIFNEFLEDVSEDILPNDAVGFRQSKIWNMLYDFQKDAALAIISKLEKFNGCILADSVGLGKTFTALSVIKYYTNRNKSVLVLCPKKLAGNWLTYKDNYKNNPIYADRLHYDVLYHTDLSRESGQTNGVDLERLNWGNYDLIVIDESHNFRNGLGTHANTHENRYAKLMERVIREGVKTKVLMLSATPVNNKFADLKNQLALAYEGNPNLINSKLNTRKPIDEIFKQAQRAFNDWEKLEANERTTDALQKKLDPDFFKLLDNVTIARSRKHIETYYDIGKVGKFPKRIKPLSLRPGITDQPNAVSTKELYELVAKLSLCVYTPSNYIFESKKYKYLKDSNDYFTFGREYGIRRLMAINLLKRLESSVHSFRLTLTRILEFVQTTIGEIETFKKCGHANISEPDSTNDDLDIEDSETDYFSVGRKVKIDLADLDYKTWERELERDAAIFCELLQKLELVTPERDLKLQKLLELLDGKIRNPINEGNKKVLIFSAFADTAEYLYEHVSEYIKRKHDLNCAVITGALEGHSTIKGLKNSINNVLSCFSPISKDRETLMPGKRYDIDVLIATDCISEGQNLQDCDYVINYDIHWNPVRIIQRFGRIDRIGSHNKLIQLVNFWPDIELDDYIKLKSRVEQRMKLAILAGTGTSADNIINSERKFEDLDECTDDSSDLEYRKQQLKHLQEEVSSLEDVSTGISIMDLGLNEFRIDLIEYLKTHDGLANAPKGMHAVVAADETHPKGAIFILKNINNSVNADNRNHIHPFYMVYVANDGTIACDYLAPKKLLDIVRKLCREHTNPIRELCETFNRETSDGKNMKQISALLDSAIMSIAKCKDESDIDSLFGEGGTTALNSKISGLDDFELVCFLAVR